MIKVVAKNVLQEGARDAVLALTTEMIEKTRREEGCISYELFELQDQPNVLAFIETWESAEHLKAHMESEHFKRIVPQVGAYVVSKEPPEIYFPVA